MKIGEEVRVVRREEEGRVARQEDVEQKVVRREGSRGRRSEEDQRRRLSSVPKAREGGAETRMPPPSYPGRPQAPARAGHRPGAGRPGAGRPLSQVLGRAGGEAKRAAGVAGEFAGADSGISSLNTSTSGSRKSVRHTVIH